jgi:hypothetical protein
MGRSQSPQRRSDLADDPDRALRLKGTALEQFLEILTAHQPHVDVEVPVNLTPVTATTAISFRWQRSGKTGNHDDLSARVANRCALLRTSNSAVDATTPQRYDGAELSDRADSMPLHGITPRMTTRWAGRKG